MLFKNLEDIAFGEVEKSFYEGHALNWILNRTKKIHLKVLGTQNIKLEVD